MALTLVTPEASANPDIWNWKLNVKCNIEDMFEDSAYTGKQFE